MKIDRRHFPILFEDRIDVGMGDDFLNAHINDMVAPAKQNMFYITQPIIEAMAESFEQMIKFRNDMQNVYRGTIFTYGGWHHCFLYGIENTEDRISIMGVIGVTGSAIKDYLTPFGGYILKSETDECKFHSMEALTRNDDLVSRVIKIVLQTELFLSFAEVETKEIKGGHSEYEGCRCTYQNKSKNPITVVDSTWYRNLIRTGAFKVRGHFRLQPYGHGMQKRRLIWINEFAKTGYSKTAKILTQ